MLIRNSIGKKHFFRENSEIFEFWNLLDPAPKSIFLSKGRANLRTDDDFLYSACRSYNILLVTTLLCEKERDAKFVMGVTGVCKNPA